MGAPPYLYAGPALHVSHSGDRLPMKILRRLEPELLADIFHAARVAASSPLPRARRCDRRSNWRLPHGSSSQDRLGKRARLVHRNPHTSVSARLLIEDVRSRTRSDHGHQPSLMQELPHLETPRRFESCNTWCFRRTPDRSLDKPPELHNLWSGRPDSNWRPLTLAR